MENTRAAKRDNNTVYIAGNETGYLVIVKSTDRGITWGNPIEHSSLASYQVRALGCIPQQNGDILLLQGFRANNEWAIFRSENGGLSFEKVMYIPTRQSWAPHMYFFRTSWGEVFTSFLLEGELKILSSSDNGKTFRIRYVGNPASINTDTHSTYSIAEGDNYRLVANIIQTNGYNYENGWYVLTSPDGGDTWTTVQVGSTNMSANSIGASCCRLANGTLVVLMGSTYNNRLCLAYSTNNGVSWTRRIIEGCPHLSSIATQDTVVFSTSDNKIYRLTDIANGTPTQVATTSYPILDFIGFEAQ